MSKELRLKVLNRTISHITRYPHLYDFHRFRVGSRALCPLARIGWSMGRLGLDVPVHSEVGGADYYYHLDDVAEWLMPGMSACGFYFILRGSYRERNNGLAALKRVRDMIEQDKTWRERR